MSSSSSAAQLRKIKKPLIEKKRREKMNEFLNQLKTLVLEGKNTNTRYSKMEKVDILEMTVRHLKDLRHIAASTAFNRNYAEGYGDCCTAAQQAIHRPNSRPRTPSLPRPQLTGSAGHAMTDDLYSSSSSSARQDLVSPRDRGLLLGTANRYALCSHIDVTVAYQSSLSSSAAASFTSENFSTRLEFPAYTSGTSTPLMTSPTLHASFGHVTPLCNSPRQETNALRRRYSPRRRGCPVTVGGRHSYDDVTDVAAAPDRLAIFIDARCLETVDGKDSVKNPLMIV